MSFLESPASASAPRAHSACSWNNDLSSALRVGCSKIPTILALPLMLIAGWSSPFETKCTIPRWDTVRRPRSIPDCRHAAHAWPSAPSPPVPPVFSGGEQASASPRTPLGMTCYSIYAILAMSFQHHKRAQTFLGCVRGSAAHPLGPVGPAD